MKNEKEICFLLASHNIRIFSININDGCFKNNIMLWIHPNKTKDEFRKDVSAFYKSEIRSSDNLELSSSDLIENDFYDHLRNLGYAEVVDVVADCFEGRITKEKSRIVDYPYHEEQVDGFGHYGWESNLV